MADQSAFDKIHVDERDKADLGGVLEQLNLPPTAVDFVRKNQRTIYIVLGVVAAIVVFWSLYGSYVENKIAKSNSALTMAQKNEGDERVTALQAVVNDFSGTSASLWAQIELARHFTAKDDNSEAVKYYEKVRQSVKESNPLFPLVTFGIAQTQESLKNYDDALNEYVKLKGIIGFESMGYTGAARIYEVKGEKEAAVKEFEEYLGTLIGENPDNSEKLYISEKITRLKASQ